MSEIFTHSPFPEPQHPMEGANTDAPLVPPPPEQTVEVSIRTMREDLGRMAQGGSPAAADQVVISFGQKSPKSQASFLPAVLWIVGAILGGGLLVGVGYYALPLLMPPAETSKKEAVPIAKMPSQEQVIAQPTSSLPAIEHSSFFRMPADRNLVMELSDVQAGSYRELLGQKLKSIQATSSFIEVQVVREGSAQSWSSFMETAGLPKFEERFWDKFEEDFTYFIHHSPKGDWPGYVLKRKIEESALLAKNSMLRLEEDPLGLLAFFQTLPGMATGTFMDAQIGGQPFRTLQYEKTKLVYGWIYNNYFILSTSEEGFVRALQQF